MMGWKQFESSSLAGEETRSLGSQIFNAILGIAMTYASLFGVGYMLYGQTANGAFRLVLAVVYAIALWSRVWK